jgi:DNA-binding CsgD family transcriptional regulator
MAGFTLNARQTALLADIAAAARVPTDDPVPLHVLEQIKTLLRANVISFSGFDTLLPHHWFVIGSRADGEAWRDAETPTEALVNPFWVNYWQKSCSYPDRSGDYDSVTTVSDFVNPAVFHGQMRSLGSWHRSEIQACIPRRVPGRHLRLVAWRGAGPDFTERDRFFLRLLKPHLAQAYWSGIHSRREPPDLTRRQLQIMRMVQTGFTNLQIAHRLEMSEGTVRTHLNHIYARLQVTSRTAAVREVFGISDDWPALG